MMIWQDLLTLKLLHVFFLFGFTFRKQMNGTDYGTPYPSTSTTMASMQRISPQPGRVQAFKKVAKTCPDAAPKLIRTHPRQRGGIWGKWWWYLRIFQHTPGTYPSPRTNSLWRNSFHLGVNGEAWGMLQGYVGVLLDGKSSPLLLMATRIPARKPVEVGPFSPLFTRLYVYPRWLFGISSINIMIHYDIERAIRVRIARDDVCFVQGAKEPQNPQNHRVVENREVQVQR